MATGKPNVHWKIYAGLTSLTLITLTVISSATRFWVLTAIPVGFLFGFFLQKGALCGASAFSEVLMMKDSQKVWGLWIAVVTGMVAFALLDLIGWVTLNPKPFTWLSMIVGGVVFGVGMVLAGGCVSGSLFKAGTGHVNNIVALLSIALGVAAVEAGPLSAANVWMKSQLLTSSKGGVITLSSLTGLPFWLLAAILLFLTTAAGILFIRRKRGSDVKASRSEKTTFYDICTRRRWKPWQAGLAIGILGAFAYLSSAASGRNYPLGVTHGVYHAQVLLTDHPVQHIYRLPPPQQPTRQDSEKLTVKRPQNTKNPIPNKKVNWWLIAEIAGLVVGSWFAARFSGEAKLYKKSADQIVAAIIGGFLVGMGAGFAKGCVIGNILSGWALMSMGTLVFGVTVILSNWVTTYFYLMGGTFSDLKKTSGSS